MTLRRSPTLALAAAVESARASSESAYSLSTPTFQDRAAACDLGSASTLLSSPLGLGPLRDRARDTLLGRWTLPDHDLLITAGAKAAIFAALRAGCVAGDSVMIVGPSWPSYADLARLLFLEPVSFEPRLEDGFAVDPIALASAMAKSRARAILFSNPNNPTGRIHPGQEIREIAEVAREFGSLLLIDESFSGVIFEPDKWRDSICSAYERLVVVNSFSKSYHLQGLRVGLCAAQGHLFEEIVSAHQTVASAASSLSQAAVLALLESDGASPDYGREREMALGFVRNEGWACSPSEGSFYLFPRVGAIDEFEAAGRAGNVFMLRGEAFGPTYADHVRLCFGKPLAELERIFAILNGDLAKSARET